MGESGTIFHHILVPTDGSQPSMAAGRLAIRLASVHQARITFVYVVDEGGVEELMGASDKTAQQVRLDLEATGQRYLNYLSRQAVAAGLPNQHLVRHGTPHTEIEQLARQEGVDLIVIGQVGRHGPRRILIGSVTERVIEYAPCPVLVVK